MNFTDFKAAKSLKDIIIQQRTIIFGLTIIVIGLIFLFSPNLRGEFRTLGIALIPAGIITAAVEFYLRKDLLRDFRETRYQYELIDRLRGLGIKNVYDSRRREDPIFGDIARMAKSTPHELKKVQVMGMSLEPFVHIVGDYIDDLLSAGCEFQFLLLDAEGEFATKRATQHETPGLLERIRSFDVWVSEHMNKTDVRGCIKVRKYDLMPSLHITIINEEKLYVNFYPVLRTGWDFPVLELDKNGKLFDKYREQFEKVWDRAKPLD